MFGRRSFAAVGFLVLSGAPFSLHSVQAFSAKPIGVGDRLVTIRQADLMDGSATLATVEAGTQIVATEVIDDWVGCEVQRGGTTISGWIDIEDLRRIDTAEETSGKAIGTAEEFRRSLDGLLEASRQALGPHYKEYASAPYVAFSLKVAQERITKAGDDFRKSDPDVWRLAGINKVRGFVYDREHDDLILVGAIEPDRALLTLDDLVVALRARFVHSEWPLVSIVPTPDTKKTEMQLVRFEGGVRDTLFGQGLLAPDYELKGLGMSLVEPGIANFRTQWDREIEQIDSGAAQGEWEISARFWFYPISSHVMVREGVCAVSGLKVGVFTEVLAATINGKKVEDLTGYKDPSADAFAKDVSNRFEELCEEHESFNRLRGLQDVVAVSKALENMEQKPELAWWLEEYPLQEVKTPKQIKVVRRRHEGGRMYYEVSGGVRLTALAWRLKRGDVRALRMAVLGVRRSQDELTWAFKVDKWVIPLPPGEVDPQQIAPLFAQAVFLQDHERHTDAVALYDRILEAKPDDAGAWNNKGAALHDLGRHEEALKCYDRALEIKQDVPNAWTGKGAALVGLGRHEEALNCCDRALEIKPDHAGAWNNKGNALGALDRHEEALKCCDRALEIKPDLGIAWNSKGVALGGLGRYEEALKSYHRAIELKPDYAEAWYNKGNALGDLGRHEEALESYDRAIELKPDDADAWCAKGAALGRLGRYQEALNCCDRALEIKPDHAGAWNNKGAALHHLDRHEEALKCCDRALEIKADLAEAWNNKGNALNRLGRHEEALKSLDRAIELKPDYAEAWINKGNALADLGRHEEALESYDRAIELKPDDADVWYGKAVALTKLDRPKEAVDCYDRAIQLKPDHAGAWSDKGWALAQLGLAVDALKCCEHAIKLKPDNPNVWYSKGGALYYLRLYDEAEVAFKQAKEFGHPGTADILRTIRILRQGALFYRKPEYPSLKRDD